MNTMERLRVFVCHGCPVMQAGLVAMLKRQTHLDCACGSAAMLLDDGALMPEVIVADHDHALELLAAVGSARNSQGRLRVLVVADSDRECDIRAAIAAGAQGYILIDDAPDHLADGIRAVRLGGRSLSPRVAARLAENMAAEALTQREQAVLGLVVDGLCNKLVANRLGIKAGTVKSHLRSAFSKLGATSRTQAIAIAHRRGLFQPQAAATGRDIGRVSAARLTPHADFPSAAPGAELAAAGL